MKQINVKLLAILFLSSLFTLIGAFFLYRFQKDRNAEGLLTRAVAKSEAGESGEAVKFYSRYLQLRPTDNEVYASLAMAMRKHLDELRELGELNSRAFGTAFSLVEQAVRMNPENEELRNTAIDFSMQFRRYTDAISHLNYLIDEDDPDPELMVKMASCFTQSGQDEKALPVLCDLIGFDRVERRFDTTKALAPKYEDAYDLLAGVLHVKFRDPESGAIVINELVKMNPESSTAYLKRAAYFRRMQNDDYKTTISRDLSRALELAPTSMPAILSAAEFAMKEREYDQAKQLYDQCLEHHPDSIFAYRGLANWALSSKDPDAAIGYLNKALELQENNSAILWARANVELETRDFDALAKTRVLLKEAGFQRSWLDFLDGRTDVVRRNWFEASQKLEGAKPQIAQSRPEWILGLNGALALCYEELGQQDKRLKACQEIVAESPGNLQARWGIIQAQLAMGQMAKAAEEYGFVERQMKAMDIKINPALLPAQLQMELLQQDRLRESQRNFSDADALVAAIRDSGTLKEPQVAKVIGAYFIAKGQPEKKQQLDKLVRQASPDNTSIVAEEVRRIANEEGIDPALERLKASTNSTGTPLTLRMMRAELLARIRPEEARQDLKALEADLASFGEDKRVQVTRGIGRIYLLMNDIGEMRRLWVELAKDRPQDVRVRLSMFELAMQAGDEDGMKEVINGLEELVGRNSAEWKWAEAVRMTWKVRNREAPASDLDDAQALATEAVGQRDGWDALYRLLGEIYVMKSQAPAAIDALEKSLKLSIGHPNVYRSLARLYYAQGDFEKAEGMLTQLPQKMWTRVENRISLDIMARSSEGLPEDLPYDKLSDRAEDHIWVAKLLTNAKRMKEAEEAFLRALEITPGHADAWTSLVKMYVAAGRIEDAKSAIRKAELELSQKEAPVFLGQAYGYLGDHKNSILNYERALESDQDNKPLLKAITESHFAANNLNKANQYVERLLEGSQANSSSDSSEVKWARRAKAQLLARAGSFHEYAEAVRAIKENATVGMPLVPEDMALWGRLAAVRPDGFSRQQALEELERIREIRDLSDDEQRVMADLYQRQDRWVECKEVMNGLLLKDDEDMKLLDPWLQWLLEHDEDQLAAVWLKKCRPGTVAEIRTKAHLQARRGNTERALKDLSELIPSKLEESDYNRLRVVAQIVEQLGEYDPRVYGVADKVWRRYVKVRPDDALLLAAFLGRRGGAAKVGEALELCDRSVENGNYEAALQLAVAILRKNRGAADANSQYKDTIRAWFTAAQDASPDNLTYLIQRAEFEDVLGNYDEAEKWLRKYMETQSVSSRQKAIVANNLAYMLALKGESDESLKLIDFSMNILGPTADLRDTLGMVHLANKQPVMALKEFEAAIADGGATAFKYVHVAMAHLVNDKKVQAAAALKEAHRKGLETFQLTKLEYESYIQMVEILKSEGLITDEDMKA